MLNVLTVEKNQSDNFWIFQAYRMALVAFTILSIKIRGFAKNWRGRVKQKISISGIAGILSQNLTVCPSRASNSGLIPTP